MSSSTPPPETNLDDYSPSATVITFGTPLPLLRHPTPSEDKPHSPPVLAFTSARSFFSAYKTTQSKLRQQCNAGARLGCSISASNNCKPRWWERLLGRKGLDLCERQRCEELVMEGCMAAAEGKCDVFAMEKCLRPFREARVVVERREVAVDVIGWVSVAGRNEVVDLIEAPRMKVWCSTKCLREDRILRGSELLELKMESELRS